MYSFVEPDDTNQAGSGMEPLGKVEWSTMDAIVKNAQRRRVEAKKQEQFNTQALWKAQEATRKVKARLLAIRKVAAMELFQPQFDEQARRISSLISGDVWASQAKPVRFQRERIWHLRKNVLPLLFLGKAKTYETTSTQLFYDVYLRYDGVPLVEPSQHGEPYIAIEGDSYYLLNEIFDFGREVDCEVVLKFLKGYTP